MIIGFRHGNIDYNINLVEGKKSDVTVVIQGITHSVIAIAEQLEDVRKVFRSLALDSFSSIEELSGRISALEGIAFARIHAIGMDTLSPVSSSDIAERRHAVETGLMRLVPRPGDPLQCVSIEQRMQELNIPGASIAVINQGKIEWASGYGELSEPVLIQAASISKTVTALTVLSLIEQCRKATEEEGRASGLIGGIIIDLDTDVSTLLDPDLWCSIDPDGMLAANDPKMTIRQLLSHTAGINVHGFKGYVRLEEIDQEIGLLKARIVQGGDPLLNRRLKQLETERLTAMQQSMPTLDGILRGEGNSQRVKVATMPGTKCQYSGGGTTILQKVIEAVTGQSFERVVRTRVFDPLGMLNSTYQPTKLSTSNGHKSDGSLVSGGWRRYPELAAAGLWTTPVDLAKMVCGIQCSVTGNGILSSELVNEMLTPQTKKGSHGFGCFVAQTSSTKYFYHSGASMGFRCIFMANSNGQGAVIMINSEAGSNLYNEMLHTIAKIYDWPARSFVLPKK